MNDPMSESMAQRLVDAIEANTEQVRVFVDLTKEHMDQIDRLHEKIDDVSQAVDDLAAGISRLDRDGG